MAAVSSTSPFQGEGWGEGGLRRRESTANPVPHVLAIENFKTSNSLVSESRIDIKIHHHRPAQQT